MLKIKKYYFNIFSSKTQVLMCLRATKKLVKIKKIMIK